ncbi:MAG: large-conductance mechanosensitive channel protein MscL [Fimbriimonadaceae bacterium]|nr:large-conductance mechanosensitive channel protein MscL [Fimbriimonadaceae bacterium]
MSMASEFKEFIAKGNVMDLAVGVIIGGAFGKIVSSLVEDVIMPPIGLILGGVNLENLSIVLKAASVDAAGKEVPAVALKYGSFLGAVINFLIIAFVIFMMVKAVNRLRKPEAPKEEAPAGPTQEELLTEIRDLLKK